MKVELKNEFIMENIEEKMNESAGGEIALLMIIGIFFVIACLIFFMGNNLLLVGIITIIFIVLIILKIINKIDEETRNKIKIYKELYSLFKLNAVERIEYPAFQRDKKIIPIIVFKDKETNQEIKRQYNIYDYEYEPIQKDRIIIDFLEKKIKLSALYVIQKENTLGNNDQLDELDYIH